MPADDFGLVGQTIDQLRFDDVVDGGGFGLVYRATHTGLGELVAVKCLRIDSGVDPSLTESFFQRFKDETRILYRLSQGSLDIVRGISSGTLRAPTTGQDVPYMVLEWLEGHTLAHEMRSRAMKGRPYSLEEAMDVFDPVFSALAHAHSQGIVHRDVKPGNLFLARGRDGQSRVKVLDFGLAKIYEPTLGVAPSVETMKGVALCSPSYGAPEQFVKRFGEIGPWTDVYALALVLLEALSNRKARHADTLVEGLGKAIAKETASPSPESLGLTLPPRVSLVLQRAVARETNVRPADAAKFRAELREAMTVPQVGPTSHLAATMVKPFEDEDLRATNVVEQRHVFEPVGRHAPSPQSLTGPRTLRPSERGSALPAAAAATAVVPPQPTVRSPGQPSVQQSTAPLGSPALGDSPRAPAAPVSPAALSTRPAGPGPSGAPNLSQLKNTAMLAPGAFVLPPGVQGAGQAAAPQRSLSPSGMGAVRPPAQVGAGYPHPMHAPAPVAGSPHAPYGPSQGQRFGSPPGMAAVRPSQPPGPPAPGSPMAVPAGPPHGRMSPVPPHPMSPPARVGPSHGGLPLPSPASGDPSSVAPISRASGLPPQKPAGTGAGTKVAVALVVVLAAVAIVATYIYFDRKAQHGRLEAPPQSIGESPT
jgi:serine/threonine-protein kinase